MHCFTIVSLVLLIKVINAEIPIGINMDGLVDWSNSLPYVNLIRQARKWGPPTAPWDENATFDPYTGWPTEDFGAGFVSAAYDLGGRYSLTATGNGDVRVTIRFDGHVENQTYDAKTNTLSATIYIPQNKSRLCLSFVNTTGPGLKNITLLQLGYNLTSKSDITNLMLAHLSRFSVIRFMDWTSTNGKRDVNWNDTTPLSWPIYREPYSNPWETIPFLVNQLDQSPDIWINIPFNSSDDYILTLARLMLKELKSSIHIYVEFSNEVWNGAFPQGRDNFRMANDSVMNHGDPFNFNYDNISIPAFWAYRRTAYQIKRVSDLFKTVFGQENVGPWKRVRPILAGQTSIYPLMEGLDYLNALYGAPRSFIHGIAIAPYFGFGPYARWKNLTVDQALAALNSSIEEFLPEQGWSRRTPLGVHATFAAWYNLSVHGYEGGPDFVYGACPSCSLDAKRNASRDDRFTGICVNFLNGWYRFGFQPLNWYSGGARGAEGDVPYNLLEDMRQEILMDTRHMFNSTSAVAQLPRPPPKLKAIDEVRRGSVKMNFGIALPVLSFNATNFMHHNDPYPDPDLRNLTVNSTFYYPLLIEKSSLAMINVTVYVAGNSSVLELALNNDQFTQVQTPQTANTTVFQPAPTVQFNIKQANVPSLVTLRLRTVGSGYSIGSLDVVPT